MTFVFAVSTDRRDFEWRPRMYRSGWSFGTAFLCFEVRVAW
jgi:hypothetical protein